MSKFRFELETAGHSEGNLVCHSLNSSCGNIDNGFGFAFGKQGSWVVSFEDIEKLYLIAKTLRELDNAR